MTVRRRIDSMSGRIFLILLIGIAAAGALGLSLSERRRVAEVRHIQTVRAIERTGAFLAAFEATPPANRVREADEPRFLRRADPGDPPGQHQVGLTDQLRAELPATVTASVASLPVGRCLPRGDGDGGDGADRARRPGLQSGTQAWKSVVAVTDCWRITARLDDGSTWAFVTGPPALLKADYGLDPVYLAVIAVAAAMLALVVARTAGAPIRRLTLAATRLEPDARSSPLAESGPSDVRAAIRAFNEMQQRLARHAVEQTYMIAAITHDLQTPMTRLRLKLEEMDDAVLRERLLSDWRAMRGLVDEGLELARSTSLSEEPVLLDIDSLIHSIVEDEREAGNAATFEVAAGRDWRCRPQMLRRCLQNLVDNAIKYGGAARLSTHVDGRGLRIEVRDPGPGIPADLLEAVFEPMVRLEESRSRASGGTGLGLTIARNLARRMGASLTIANVPEGGLACVIRFA